jgi:hypothetical protein
MSTDVLTATQPLPTELKPGRQCGKMPCGCTTLQDKIPGFMIVNCVGKYLKISSTVAIDITLDFGGGGSELTRAF